MFIPEPCFDQPEEKVVGYCGCCGGEIYEGELYYAIEGEQIHEDCLGDYAKKHFAGCLREAGADV